MLLALLSAPVAHAAPRAADGSADHARTPTRAVVAHFTGPSAELARGAVTDVLERAKAVDLLSVRLLDAHKKLLDGSAAGDRAALKELEAGLLVRGAVHKKGGQLELELSFVGTAADASETLSFHAASAAKLRSAIQRELPERLGPVLERVSKPEAEPEAKATSVPETPPAEPEPSEGAESADADAAGNGDHASGTCPWLSVEAHPMVLTRSFDYQGEQSGALRGYNLKPAPGAGLLVAWYPLAHASCKPLSGLGLRAGYERAFAIQSTLANQDLSTTAFTDRLDVMFRFPFGHYAVSPRIGYAGRHFDVAGGLVPAAHYHALGIGFDAEARFGRYIVELSATGKRLLGIGQLKESDWFPQASGLGYDADLRAGAALGDAFELLLSGRIDAFSIQLNPAQGATHPNGVAESASDRYLEGLLLVRYRVSPRLL